MDRRRLFLAAAAATAAFVPRIVRAQDSDADANLYTGSIVAINHMMTYFFEEVTRLTENFGMAQMTDEEWRVDILAPFSIPRAAQQALLEITPPAVFVASFESYSEAIDHAVQAGDYMKSGILNMDADSLNLASAEIEATSELITQATAALPST
jgi:hypothetical protein